MENSKLTRIAGSTLAGAVGFAAGFYTGFFLLLSIWGLEVDELAFVFIAGGFGVLFAGAAIAFTVTRSRRLSAILTAVGLGVVMLPLLLLFDADAGGMAIGGLALVILTATLIRTGAFDAAPS
ncbi:MAG: hypothetical protein PVJ28_04140 [Acidimicrobiia bacterium]|jgi:hypothetical protein